MVWRWTAGEEIHSESGCETKTEAIRITSANVDA